MLLGNVVVVTSFGASRKFGIPLPPLYNGYTKRVIGDRQLRIFTRHWGLILSIAISLGAYGGLVRLHFQAANLNNGSVPFTLAWVALAWAAYLGAILWAEWRGGLSLPVIWAGALVFRLFLLWTTPTLSSDVYRYMWDGYVTTQGVSPYAYAIDAPELDYLDNPQRAQANHTWMASPYLPAAQLLFVILAWLFPLQPLFFQIAMVSFDLMSGWLIIRLLNLAGLPGYRALIYLWNPLVVVEVAHGAHVDAWMIFLMLLALWLTFASDRPGISTWLAPLVLALAILTKGLPVLLLAILFWQWRRWQTALCGVVVLLLLAVAGLQAGWGLGGPLDGAGLFGALRIYADRWNFNSGLFHWLEVGLQDLGLAEANRWAKRGTLVVMLLVLAGVWLRAKLGPPAPPQSPPKGGKRNPLWERAGERAAETTPPQTLVRRRYLSAPEDPPKGGEKTKVSPSGRLGGLNWLRAKRPGFVARSDDRVTGNSTRNRLRLMAVPFMAYILLTTTVHPWYVLILLVFVPFLAPGPGEPVWRWPAVVPWLYLSGAVALSYITYLNPSDLREYEWVRNIEWLPTLALLLIGVIFERNYNQKAN